VRKHRRRLLVLISTFGVGTRWYCYTPEPTILSFRIGQTFEEVARISSYPVMEHSNRPTDDPGRRQFGDTWVTEPSVIIRFNDPKHGFTLPPTKFAALAYADNRAVTLSTSPMLEKLPFDAAVALLENLQNQFKAGGWEPWKGDGSEWFDLTPEGKNRLYARMFKPGLMQTTELRVPKKYAMVFRLWCAEGCARREPPYLFLIDVGVGEDVHSWFDDEKSAPSGALFRDESHQISQPTSARSGTSLPKANPRPSHPDATTSSRSAPRARRAAS
jgi:hypothetical protein